MLQIFQIFQKSWHFQCFSKRVKDIETAQFWENEVNCDKFWKKRCFKLYTICAQFRITSRICRPKYMFLRIVTIYDTFWKWWLSIENLLINIQFLEEDVCIDFINPNNLERIRQSDQKFHFQNSNYHRNSQNFFKNLRNTIENVEFLMRY